ncbi:IucA/IucC family protein [Planotetraspora kaengkrachanensis]|uniref:Vibrioferrin biosynthesis protein PvsB n=1 Tax=Planotetraspora kaengkrachanensis TaxID=575193 RepID=A0A8J3M8W8_9ACTN|nr:IucA/IucC family protein [Planotetraspora kaengkrachanensis]GIG80130.1 vibrioferrin biosynthesis protein PvsB [Planotetraspora kaengkrachanensis]
MTETPDREAYLAVRVLDSLLREDYGSIASIMTSDKDGVAVVLASGRRIRLATGSPFQDFAVAEPGQGQGVSLAEVLDTLAVIADPADGAGVAAFARECREALAGLELHDRHRAQVAARLRGREGTLLFYEALAAAVDHPIYPTARCRLGVPEAGLVAHAPEFAPSFELAWAAVPGERVTVSGTAFGAVSVTVSGTAFGTAFGTGRGAGLPDWWPTPGDIGLPGRLAGTHVPFPVHPLTVPVVEGLPGVVMGVKPYLTVRPTLSMRTVEVDDLTHLKVPLATSTLGLLNRRSIKPGTLRDGALAESLLREVLAREPAARVAVAGEQNYGHAGHEYLGWLVRNLPEGEIVPVAALLAPWPDGEGDRLVLHHLAERHYGGDVHALLRDYLSVLLSWNALLFVRYGLALEAHQQNLALVFGDGPMRLLVKDNDGLLVSPGLLGAAGIEPPNFSDHRMLTDDPHALADVFVTITLHLAAAAIVFPALVAGRPESAASALIRDALSAALEPFGDDPMARLLRARTLESARLVGKSMVVAGTLVDKRRSGAADINKFYGVTGPNYLRP